MLLFFIVVVSPITLSEPIQNSDLVLRIISPEHVEETAVFSIQVVANETAVEDAIVLVMDTSRKERVEPQIKKTNTQGIVECTAPPLPYVGDIQVTIYAFKPGYISAEKNITILDLLNLAIKEPLLSYYTTQEVVDFTIVSWSNNTFIPIQHAIIEFNSNHYGSDEQGKVTVPMPDEIGEFKLIITKPGYVSFTTVITVDAKYHNIIPLYYSISLIILILFVTLPLVIVFKVVYKKLKKK